MLTPRQIRAARGLLGWEATELGKRTGLSRETIANIESGRTQAREGSLERIAEACGGGGVEFTENEGVRLKPGDIELFVGPERFNDFTDFVYEHLKRCGGDVCVNAIDERLFAKYRKDHELHRRRMKELVDIGRATFRILASESSFTSAYAKHRWMPSVANAAPASFYAFGDCLALISFQHDPAPYVALHKSGPFAEIFRQSFNVAWENAKESPRAK
jgi:transcriptional regulator with XRE-family HTH domain